MGLRRGAEGGGPALLAAAAASTPSAVIIGLQEHAAQEHGGSQGVEFRIFHHARAPSSSASRSTPPSGSQGVGPRRRECAMAGTARRPAAWPGPRRRRRGCSMVASARVALRRSRGRRPETRVLDCGKGWRPGGPRRRRRGYTMTARTSASAAAASKAGRNVK